MVTRRQLHILLVDDSDLACAATALMLESLGYRVTCETESFMALRHFSEDPDDFDFAIIEPVMPHLTGLELAVRLRRIRLGFPVLFYAAYVDESLYREIESHGLWGVVSKPLRANELSAAIEEWLSVERPRLKNAVG